MPSKDTTEKLNKLRDSMKKLDLEAYIVYSEDAHGSEYIAESDKRRAFISNFTGSAGTAVITSSKAALWTDGRYYLQASQQLDSNWTLMKDRLPETPSIQDWLVSVLPPKSRVGLDPTLVSLDAAKKLEETFEPKGHKLVSVNDNLIDAVWTDRPACPSGKVFAHPIKFSGQSHQDKFTKIREHLEKEECQALAVSALDEIAWLFNLRGSDIDYNPVFISYAVLGKTYATLYVDSSKISKEVLDHLGSVVEIKPYNAVFADLKNLNAQKQKVWIDSSKSSLAISSCVDASLTVTKPSPITLAKSLKNEAELAGLRACHLRDAAALVNYFSWLEERLESGDDSLNECSVADKVDSLRSEQSDFVSLSFDTISSSGPNGAIIHYKPQPESCAKVVKNQLYLCDSGGQYKDGTTDVTRTLHFGTPTQHEKNSFTRVLKGVISLDSAVFPRGTTGRELDILARMHLWEAGLDYRHGTGHGVGAFLNVHEGPQSISFRDPPYKVPMEPGMTVTNEPGYYEDGAFGIRIENVMAVKEIKTEFNFGEKGYLGFEHMTYVPIQTKLMEISLMSKKDIEWVNKYHKECLEKVAPLVQGKALEWLKKETQPI